MKISIGMITNKLQSSNPILKFLENAKKFGHTIDRVIMTCSTGADERTVRAIREKVSLSIIDLNRPQYLEEQLRQRGISSQAAQTLLTVSAHGPNGRVPYGFNRNQVLMEAILKNIDILIFVDSDVIPSVLTLSNGELVLEEIDFVGEHLASLMGGAQITTSEYSGYNILPPARFDGMEDLLIGLQKDDLRSYWEQSDTHHCIMTQAQAGPLEPCTKVLGGNAGFRLEVFSVMPPFYSPYYTADDGYYLARGEDTVLSLALKPNGITCTNIQTMIFHDTYKNYPKRPDLIHDASTQERFYYACTGWIGRNPFYNYLLGGDPQEVRELQRRHLASGASALAEYTSNPRFLTLPDKLEISWNNLERYIREYNRLMDAWSEFAAKVFRQA